MLLLAVTTVGSYYSTHWANDHFPGIDYMGDSKDVALPYHVFPSLCMFAILALARFTNDAFINQDKVASLEREKLQSELQGLRAQVNPHFLFNALNTVYGLSRKNNEQASDAVLKLSEILRYIIYDCDVDFITLEQELTFLNYFIEFARLRLRENAQIEFRVDAIISNEKLEKCKFLLQCDK